jgi:hypothetical protein
LRSHDLILVRTIIAGANKHNLRVWHVLRKHLQPQPQISKQLL